jgi:hypothetical protein
MILQVPQVDTLQNHLTPKHSRCLHLEMSAQLDCMFMFMHHKNRVRFLGFHLAKGAHLMSMGSKSQLLNHM